VWLTLAKDGGHPQAAAALAAVKPLLTAADQARVDVVFKPKK
jgi:hypothetical protein